MDIRAVADEFLCKCVCSVCKSVAEAGSYEHGSVCSRVAYVGAQQGFLRQGNTRAAERPTSPRKRNWWGLGLARTAATGILTQSILGSTTARAWHCSLCSRRACRKGVTSLSAQKMSSVGGHHPPRKNLVMVSTWEKAVPSALSDVAIQTELPWKHIAVQDLGCRACQSLSLVIGGSSENSCVRCDQAPLSGRATWGSRKVWGASVNLRERDWQCHSVLPETDTGTAARLKTAGSEGSCILPLPGRRQLA